MDVTVLKAKSNLSALLRKAEAGEPVYIRRGRKGARFRIVPEQALPRRTLAADPQWQGQVAYEDEAIWESEWSDDQ